MPSRLRAISSRIANARSMDCMPPRRFESDPAGDPPEASEIEEYNPFLRHVAHGIARPLASDAARLDAAIGHLIGAPRRRAVDDHAAHPQRPNGPQAGLDRPREDTALQAVGGGADSVERRLQIAIPLHGDDGPENLIANDSHVTRHVGQRGTRKLLA